ncbi:MAG: response regulator [Cytophagaceae bacterium]|nr:response regulator [Cytophagaceae bacterium]MBL0301247.1 response regulator [Cytophagaceae bacterium]MBL0324064.1 response regulator [Cytophagaceae bacterium]
MKTKILVVDDESDLQILIKQKFRKQIREEKYEFIFAENGRQALEMMDTNSDISMVLSDINMPEMDGLTLLVKLSESNPLTKVVMVSAYGDMENIRTAMNRGAFDFVCKPVNFDDLETTMEKTIKHIDQIRQTFEAIRENNILKMYVDDSVLNFMSRQEFEKSLVSSDLITASVVFMDICGFTAISEKEKPDVVVSLINKYFDIMVKGIIAQNGIIDKFMGDAVMAIFKGDYHLDRAVEASLAVREEIDKIIDPIDGRSEFIPKVAIGIKSGEMVSGNIGSVTLKRLDYTVIGDTVNTAQRLQSVARESQIIIAEDDYQIIKDSFVCKEKGSVSLKNKAGEVKIYEVMN